MTQKSVYPLVQPLVLAICVFILVFDATSAYLRQMAATSLSPQIIDTSPRQQPDLAPGKTAIGDLLGVPSRVISFKQLKTINQTQIQAAQTAFVGTPSATLVSDIAVYSLEYEIKGHKGEWQAVSAVVYLPATAGEYPLFVFGSGTTGMADKCAPSLENLAVENIGNYHNQMITQTAAGYVSVFPDYEGFHDSQATQAYFISDSEAQTLLGAIRSLVDLQSTTPSLKVIDFKAVFLAGYSQGGHAALSAAQQWQTLPPDIKLKGVIQYAGAADVEALFWESPWLASYLVSSYVEYYRPELSAHEVLQERWLQEMATNNETLCVNQAYKYYPHAPNQIYIPAFLDAIETNVWPASLKKWQQIIAANTPMTNLPDVPYLSIQGESDPIVTAKTQKKNVALLCEQGKHVLYQEYAQVNHFRIRQESLNFSTDWMNAILAGRPTASTCL